MNTKQIGTITEYKVLSRLLELGFNVSIPIGDNLRYDVIVDFEGHLVRCQIKTARNRSGSLRFNAGSSRMNSKGYIRHDYKGDVEFFLAYHSDSDTYVFYPCNEHMAEISIRIKPPKNSQVKK